MPTCSASLDVNPLALFCSVRQTHSSNLGEGGPQSSSENSLSSATRQEPGRIKKSIHIPNTLTSIEGAGGIPPHRQALAYKVFQSALSASGPVELDGVGDLSSPDGVHTAFANSVRARTVGNATLTRYIKEVNEADYNLAEAAVRGAREAGLRIDPTTHEALLGKLVEAGQLRPAMELYRDMIQHRVTPTAKTYAILMRLCMDRGSHSAVTTLFSEMQRKGIQPTSDAYEVVLTSISCTTPVKWELAVQIFDSVSAKNPKLITARVYNGLMRVYLNMSPFDWRIVYNCYFELRSKHNNGLMLTWESYELVELSMKRGRAGWYRRSMTFVDAWFNMTHIKELRFWKGCAMYAFFMLFIKFPVAYLLKWTYELVRMSFDFF